MGFTRRRLSVVVSDGKKKQLITKGAVEEILSICTMVDYNGEVSEITKEIKNILFTLGIKSGISKYSINIM